jgi:putative membrane protein
MVRIGFLAIAIIPLIFLILMFSLESKIVFLTLWIISIIAISVWLIVIEYIHTKLEEQKEMAGMSYEEMLENFRGKEAE